MEKREMDALAQFCVAQRSAFSVDDWLARAETDPEAVGLAAAYLSMASWYGYETELEEIARRNHFSADSAGLHRETRAIGFDLPYFSSRVRVGVATSHRAAA